MTRADLMVRLFTVAGLALLVLVGALLVTHTTGLTSVDNAIVQWVFDVRGATLPRLARTVTDLGYFGLLLGVTVGVGLVLVAAGAWTLHAYIVQSDNAESTDGLAGADAAFASLAQCVDSLLAKF